MEESSCDDDGGRDFSAVNTSRRQQQHLEDLNFSLVSSIDHIGPQLSDFSNGEFRASGCHIQYLPGHDTMFGAPGACSTELQYSFSEEDIINSMVPKDLEIVDRFAEFETELSQHPIGEYHSSNENLSQHSNSPLSNPHGPCNGNQISAQLTKEFSLSQHSLSSDVSNIDGDCEGLIQGFDDLIQNSTNAEVKPSQLVVVDAFDGDGEVLTHGFDTLIQNSNIKASQLVVVDAFDGNDEGLTQGFDTLIQDSTKSNVKASQLVVVDAIVGTSDEKASAEPQFTVIDAQSNFTCGNPESPRLQMDDLLTQFTIVDTFVDITMSPMFSRYECDGEAQVEAVCSIGGSPRVSVKEEGFARSKWSTSAPACVKNEGVAVPGDTSADTGMNLTSRAVESLPHQQTVGTKENLVTNNITARSAMKQTEEVLVGGKEAVSDFRKPRVPVRPLSLASDGLALPLGKNVHWEVEFNNNCSASAPSAGIGNLSADSECSFVSAVGSSCFEKVPESNVWIPLKPVDDDCSDCDRTMCLETACSGSDKTACPNTADVVSDVAGDVSEVTQLGVANSHASSAFDLHFDEQMVDNSILTAQDGVRVSIGDTIVHTGRAPIKESTPIAKGEVWSVRKHLAMQTIKDLEEHSDSERSSKASAFTSVGQEEDGFNGKTSVNGSEKPNADFEKSNTNSNADAGAEAFRGTRKLFGDGSETDVHGQRTSPRTQEFTEKLNSESSRGLQFTVSATVTVRQNNLAPAKEEKLRSPTSSCSLEELPFDTRVFSSPKTSEGIGSTPSSHSGSFTRREAVLQRQEPLGEANEDPKASSLVLSMKRDESKNEVNPRDSYSSEDSDVEKMQKLYLACLSEVDDLEEDEEEESKINKKREDMKEEESKNNRKQEDMEENESENNMKQEEGRRHSENSEELHLETVKICGQLELEDGIAQKFDSNGSGQILRNAGEKVEKGNTEGKSNSDTESLIMSGRRDFPSGKSEVADVDNADFVSDNDSLGSSLPRSGVSVSDIEDGLSEDVKRILEKYGRRFPKQKSAELGNSDFEAKSWLKVRHFGDSDVETVDVAKDRSLKSVSVSKETVNSPTFGSDLESRRTLGSGSRTNQLTSVLLKQGEHGVESSSESSDDTLGKRVSHLLATTGKSLEPNKPFDVACPASPNQQSSVRSSLTGSVDYNALNRDLDELQSSLDSMKKSDFRLLDSKISGIDLKLTENEVGSVNKASGMSSSGLCYLLTSGVVPISVALDMVHGSTDVLSDDGISRSFARRTSDAESGFDGEAGELSEIGSRSSVTPRPDGTAIAKKQSAVSILAALNKSSEEEMESLSRSRISSLPDSFATNGLGSKSFAETITTKRGSSLGGRAVTSLPDSRQHSLVGCVTLHRGLGVSQGSVQNVIRPEVEGHSEHVKASTCSADHKDALSSSGYSGSESLARSEASLNSRVGNGEMAAGWSRKAVFEDSRLTPGNLTSAIMSKVDMKKGLLINQSIGFSSRGSGVSSSNFVAADKLQYRDFGIIDGTTSASSQKPAFHSETDLTDYIASTAVPKRSSYFGAESDYSRKDQRPNTEAAQSGIISDGGYAALESKHKIDNTRGVSDDEDHSASRHILNETFPKIACETSLVVSDVHESEFFDDDEPQISKVTTEQNGGKFSGLSLERIESESQEGAWSEGPSTDRDKYYLSESVIDSGEDCSSDNRGKFQISPVPKQGRLGIPGSFSSLCAAQLDKVMTSSFETSVDLGRPAMQKSGLHLTAKRSHHEFDEGSGDDSSHTLLINDLTAEGVADETVVPATLLSHHEDRSDSQTNSQEDPVSSNGILRTSFTTVTSLRDSTDCESNLPLDLPVPDDVRLGMTSVIVPYKPKGSREVFYVDSGGEDGSLSAATVESTHPGSDDARGPRFPVHLLGSRSDAPMDVMSQKQKEMASAAKTKPAQESSDCIDNVVARTDKTRRLEFQQSQEKTKNWVDGISLSLPDMCTPTKVDKAKLASLSESNVYAESGHGRTGFDGLPGADFGRAFAQEIPASGSKFSDGAALNAERNTVAVDRGSAGKRASLAIVADVANAKANAETFARSADQPLQSTHSPLFASDSRPVLTNSHPILDVNLEAFKNRPSPESRVKDLEKNFAKEILLAGYRDRQLALEARLPRTSGGVPDSFVSERYTTRFESHYGVMPTVQAVVDKYADENGKEMRQVLEEQQKERRSESQMRLSGDSTRAAQARRSVTDETTEGVESVKAANNRLGTSKSGLSLGVFPGQLLERFHDSTGSSSFDSTMGDRRANSSVMRLMNLVKNPTQELVRHLQSEREERRRSEDRGERVDHDADLSMSKANDPSLTRSAESCRTYVVEAGRARERVSNPEDQKADDSRGDRDDGQQRGQRDSGDHRSRQTRYSQTDARRGVSANGAGENSSSEDERRERRHDFTGQHMWIGEGRKKEERAHKKEEIVSKRAWIIHDEALPAVPEDATIGLVTSGMTSNDIGDNGNHVTHTTKRHLPDDPKLLKLQEKIARQKDKYKRAYLREAQRKKKIEKLESFYKAAAGCGQTTLGSSLESFSRPSSIGFDSTSSQSLVSESSTCASCSEVERSTCICLHLKPQTEVLRELAVDRSKTKLSPTKKRGDSTPVLALELREVDYSEDGDPERRSKRPGHTGATSSAARKSEKSPRRKSPAKTQRKGSSPPSLLTQGRSKTVIPTEKVSASIDVKKVGTGVNVRKASSADFGMTFPTPRHEVEKRSRGIQTVAHDHDRTERRPYKGSRPYDMEVISIPVAGRVKMKSQSCDLFVQGMLATDMPLREQLRKGSSEARMKVHATRPRKPVPRGISWFIPLKASKSSDSRSSPDQRLRETVSDWLLHQQTGHSKQNQSYVRQTMSSVTLETGADFDRMTTILDRDTTADSENLQKSAVSAKTYPLSATASMMRSNDPTIPSLQEAFRANMQPFISRSRRREKHIALRADERRMQELHEKERMLLFNSTMRSKALRVDPISEQLFKPRKRWFTQQQMKMMTNRRYRNLPEVMKMVEERQKTEQFRANRQRVQMFKQKILSHVLGEKTKRTTA